MINADRQLNAGQGVLGYNLFTYCGNNPVSRSDSTGNNWLDDLAKKTEKAWNATVNAVSSAWNATANAVSSAWNTTASAVSSAYNATAQWVGDTWNTITQWVSNAWEDTTTWVSNAATDAWSWTKQAASDTGQWIGNASKAVGNFFVDRFSTPEKASNTFSALALATQGIAITLGGVALFSAPPTAGSSIPTVGVVALAFEGASFVFTGVALAINIFNEE